jgi:general stress protein 26
MPDLKQALSTHHMWFGSYTRAGVLKKVEVWCFPHNGHIEFITAKDSLKAKRAARNPKVICFVGSEDGPAVPGTAELVENRAEVWRGYRTYWKIHRGQMLLMWPFIRGRVASGRQIMIRVHPNTPLPLG